MRRILSAAFYNRNGPYEDPSIVYVSINLKSYNLVSGGANLMEQERVVSLGKYTCGKRDFC